MIGYGEWPPCLWQSDRPESTCFTWCTADGIRHISFGLRFAMPLRCKIWMNILSCVNRDTFTLIIKQILKQRIFKGSANLMLCYSALHAISELYFFIKFSEISPFCRKYSENLLVHQEHNRPKNYFLFPHPLA